MKYSVKICSVLSAVCFLFAGCSKKNDASARENNLSERKVKIGIAKIVQHVALDQIEQGIIDIITETGIDADYDLQNANGDVNTAAQIANKYKAEKVDIAVGIATPVAVALANAIKTIPVVFGTVTDPVGAGLVQTLEHGEKNVTGMSDAIPTKEHITLFKRIAGIQTLGYIYTSNEANSVSALKLVEDACRENNLELIVQAITNSSEVKQASEAIVDRVDGIYLTTDNTVFSALPALVQVFEKAKKPVFSGDVTGAMNGGIFMASGFNYYKAGRATGEIVVSILNGAKPSEIPIRFMTDPSDSDLLFDLDAAKNCGITVPEEFLAAAGYIFENGTLRGK
ncbi:MAG: ABC transporter substrate-binding protein [Bacteroides sp.]|nr:ABC transporter substrate-binding protein [Prevotella sp.]MCM1408803.1 ABC transporter substrate-binding protein [Treponema brennaborense]MCM1470583.1 ABC transporter substrate-binding protein [Bacteroides sp.]